ncbi:MAG: hypothetical protein PHN55_01685 [Dysgonamonadaceae bacterium]|nr:hypothetical protein [Dysgonamonadaceae bacterium]
MEINKLLILSFIFVWSFSGCKASQCNEFNMLRVKDTQINDVLEVFIKEEAEYGNLEKSVIIIKSEKSDNSNEIRIGALYKESMSSYLMKKKDRPIGFFDYEGVTVIVFGENENLLFEKTNIKKIIPFLEAKPDLKIKEGEVPPPPVIYEPIVWIYLFNNGKLELVDKGRFTLII